MLSNAPARIHFKQCFHNASIGAHSHRMCKKGIFTYQETLALLKPIRRMSSMTRICLVNNIRTVCSFTSTVLSNKTTSSAIAAPTQASGAGARSHFEAAIFVGVFGAFVALFS